MARLNKFFAAILLIATLPLGGWSALPESPDSQDLLQAALNPPDTAYQGRMSVTYWYGKQSRTEEVEVYHDLGGKTRREFLAPDAQVERIVISDGEREQVRNIKNNRSINGDAIKSYYKLMAPDQERALLIKNYRLLSHEPEMVAGRKAYVLELQPVVAGKPHQVLWVDKDTGVILENKRFLPRQTYAAQAAFTRFEPREDFEDSLFAFEQSTQTGANQGLEPDFMSLADLNKATGKSNLFPPSLPAGFVFESADFFQVGKQTVRHARYTDGLAVISLFQTDRPVRLPSHSYGVMLHNGRSAVSFHMSSSGQVLPWKRGKIYYTLMGDASKELLQNISRQLR